jgi:CelD/BcsL family acetyltransferase involved in cellulose biosynthesis
MNSIPAAPQHSNTTAQQHHSTATNTHTKFLPPTSNSGGLNKSMQIKVIDNFQDFLNLENSWNRLFEKSSEHRVYLTFDWFRCWWEAFGGDKQLFILTIAEDDDIILISPLCITEDKIRGFKIKKLSSIANGVSPSWDFIGAHSNGTPLGLLVEKIFSQKDFWDVVEFQKINKSSMTYNLLSKILEKRDYGIMESIKSPQIEVNGTWDDFLSKRSVRFRKALRNKINRAEKSGDLNIVKVNKKEDLKEALQDVFLVSSRSWKETQRTSITSSVKAETFYRKATDLMGNKEWVEIWTLKKGDLPIAFEYHIKYKDIVYPIRADYDETYRDLSPGSLLEYTILKDIFTNKTQKVYDSCGHTYKYLLNWSTKLNEYYNFYVFNPNIKSHFLSELEFKLIPFLRKIGIRKYWKQNNKYASRKNWENF